MPVGAAAKATGPDFRLLFAAALKSFGILVFSDQVPYGLVHPGYGFI